MERRLSAILVADIVAFSRLMGADEPGTLAELERVQRDVLDPVIADFGGQVLKGLGDGWIVGFPNVTDAVNGAVGIQETLADHSRLQLRIGVHLGDVTFHRGDVYGDGINVATRLEAIARAGEVTISDTVHHSLDEKSRHGFQGGDPLELKNIARPVPVWRWSPSGNAPNDETARPDQPDKPAIAVLPFANMSGDTEQDYFCDGITEDIITGLSRFRTLFVIARHSSFALRDEKLSMLEIGNRLGVQFVVEGSIRRVGNHMRVSVQLVETRSGNHLWAERYDRELDDIFAVQDEVTRSIVAILPGVVQETIAGHAALKPTRNMKAYEHMLRGKSLRDGLNAEDTARARFHFEQALQLDPGYARAYMYLADTYVVDLWLGLAEDGASGRSLDLSRKGAGLDNTDVYIQDQLGFAFLCERLWQDAEAQFTKTLSHIVNEAESMAWCGYGFLLLGQHERALSVVQEAVRLDPLHAPSLDWVLGQAHFMVGDYAKAVLALIGEALLNSLGHAFLVSAYAHMGRQDEASRALDAFVAARNEELQSRGLEPRPRTVTGLAGDFRRMWRNPEDWEHLAAGLEKAGLPGNRN